jgi:hypothetical protein
MKQLVHIRLQKSFRIIMNKMYTSWWSFWYSVASWWSCLQASNLFWCCLYELSYGEASNVVIRYGETSTIVFKRPGIRIYFLPLCGTHTRSYTNWDGYFSRPLVTHQWFEFRPQNISAQHAQFCYINYDLCRLLNFTSRLFHLFVKYQFWTCVYNVVLIKIVILICFLHME